MKKLSFIAILAVWIIILAFVIIQWASAPSKDEYKAVISYADIIENYAEGKPIDASRIENLGNNTGFTIITAGFFSNLQRIELPLNDSYNAIVAGREVNSLLNAEASARIKGIIPGFITDANTIHAQREELYDKYIADIKKLPTKGLIFPIDPMIKSINNEKPKREAYKNDLAAVATYIIYIIDFVDSRRGGNYFTSDGQRLIFSSPDDQKYYDELVAQMEIRKRSVDKYRADLKSVMDAAVNNLRSSKKNK